MAFHLLVYDFCVYLATAFTCLYLSLYISMLYLAPQAYLHIPYPSQVLIHLIQYEYDQVPPFFLATAFLLAGGPFGGGGFETFLTIAGAFLGQDLIAALAALTEAL